MDRNSITRTLLILAIFGGIYFLFIGRKSSDHVQEVPAETYLNAPGFEPDAIDALPALPQPPEGEICTIGGNRYSADFSTRGAGLTHFRLTDARYANSDAR